MRLDVSGLPVAAELSVAFSETISVPPEYMLTQGDVDVSFDGKLMNTGTYYLLEGKGHAVLKSECDKCLTPLKISITFKMEEKFSESEDTLDDDFWFFQDDVIDLVPAIETNLLINIPIRFLCGEDCKGLCKFCGQNKNIRECGCAEDSYDPRFDVLRDLFQ